MAILQALISLLTRSVGKILNAIFGWAVVALFGQTSPKEQTMLSGVVAAAAAWPLLVLGIIVPKVTLFVVSFVPLSKSVPNLWLRIIWIALAILVPFIVGSVIAARSPSSTLPEPRWKKLLRGFQVTFTLALAFLLMIVIAPTLKIANVLTGRIDVRLPLLVRKGAGGEMIDTLVAALAAYGIVLRRDKPPWMMTAPAAVMRTLGGRAFASFVSEGTHYHHGDGLQLNLNPNELLLRGKPDRVLRAQTVAQEVVAPREVLMTMNAQARELEEQIKRVWSVYAEEPHRHRDSKVLRDRVQEIGRELAQSDVPFDEWQIVYRELLQLDRALHGELPLLAQEEEMAEAKRPAANAERIALPPRTSVPARIESLSNKELLKTITGDAVMLAKKEVELAKAELKADLKSEIGMAKGLTIAGLCAIWAVSLILVAVAFALSAVMPGWVAALLVAAAVLIAGGIAGMVGWGMRVKDPLETTRRTLKEDVRWAKERIA